MAVRKRKVEVVAAPQELTPEQQEQRKLIEARLAAFIKVRGQFCCMNEFYDFIEAASDGIYKAPLVPRIGDVWQGHDQQKYLIMNMGTREVQHYALNLRTARFDTFDAAKFTREGKFLGTLEQYMAQLYGAPDLVEDGATEAPTSPGVTAAG